MSKPPSLPPIHAQHTTSPMPTMTETQSAPQFPPPAFLDYSQRRLPQPIQLPPLTIPPPPPSRSDFQYSPTVQHLPSIHSRPPPPPPSLSGQVPSPIPGPPHHTAPARYHHPRSHSGSAAPLEKLLSPHPFTPPRSDPAYSPQYEPKRSPPRSAVDTRPPPSRLTEKFHLDDSRPSTAESVFASPVESQRHPFASFPSPQGTSNFPSSSTTYRGSVGSHRGSTGSAYAPPGYPEPVTTAPKMVSMVPPPPSSTGKERPLKYELRVRQQPVAARACGFGERDRRVIDPPPIVQLHVTDTQTGSDNLDELRYSLNVVHCTLYNADGTSEETALIQPDRRTTRRLMGQLVASPCVAKDEHDIEGCFFCFPDLSCRTHGHYRLRFVLMRIDPTDLHVGGSTPIITEVLSDVFTVYTAKDFPGMRPSSALTRALKLQGCNIQVKKGNEKALTRKRASTSDDDDAGGDGRRDKRRKE
ncbi:hypothetical protein P152DRAFT_214840 [Eremomyces bilateralis CBS 781.70]|uniref:Velvet domain-containing protein n=1 Tax=Eremomyces bilateralis CBS 781.70 TaxID=1392243 RepID=A0A6G1FS61_9PEZI|nr:uncharacterized protein P152DRAFT_214840 [Eremomyces bilateralis CBS 781.70]KAF1808613.1 hypothetical protein P152DRAFT_214840 [Eremomyces bilateralis CBS 781.70]